MVDCRGKLLRAGDLVSIAWAHGHVIGTLIYDPDDIRYKTLRIEDSVDGKTRFAQKASSRVLNLSAIFNERFDTPLVSVLQ